MPHTSLAAHRDAPVILRQSIMLPANETSLAAAKILLGSAFNE